MSRPAHSSAQPRAYTNVLHLLVLSSATFASLLWLRFDPTVSFGIAVGIATWGITVTLYRTYVLTGDALNAFTLSGVILLLLYPLHGVLMHDHVVVIDRLGVERFEYLTYGLLIATAGIWMMYRGFATGRRGRFSRLVERLSRPIDDAQPVVSRKVLALVAVGLIARLLHVATRAGTYVDLGGGAADSGPSSVQFVLATFASLGLVAGLYLFVTGLAQRHRARTAIGLAIILGEAIWGGFFSGSRYQLFAPVIAALAVYSRSIKPIRMRTFVMGLLLFAFVLFPLATAYKDSYLSKRVELQREGLSTDIVSKAFAEADFELASLDNWWEPIGIRFHALSSLALIVRYTPERHPYLWGLPYALLPVDIAVPRFIWPDKPALRQFAVDFRHAYWGMERGTRTAVKPSQFGELWANLHLLGVLIGAWVWGRVLRFMYSFLALGGRASRFGHAVYASTVPGLLNTLEGELATGLTFILKSLIVWVACTWFLGERARRRREREASPYRPTSPSAARG